ncbi:MAG: hypothetical protein V4581_18585 [Bacteroidota bacterium]
MSNTNFPGAYSSFTCKIDDSAQQAFKEAVIILGVKYSPVAVSQQVVAGLNYKFFCNTETVSPFPHQGAAMVSIYKPLNGSAHLTGIKNID